MNYSIRQTLGDSTVEITGENVEDTFALFLLVQRNAREQQPEADHSHLTSLLRQVLDAIETGGAAE